MSRAGPRANLEYGERGGPHLSPLTMLSDANELLGASQFEPRVARFHALHPSHEVIERGVFYFQTDQRAGRCYRVQFVTTCLQSEVNIDICALLKGSRRRPESHLFVAEYAENGEHE